MKYDLHVHTNYSDGLDSPKVVIDNAIRLGLNGIAITDHDSVLGIEEGISYSKDIGVEFNVIPGIELSCIHESEEVHILGYLIDYKDCNILNVTKRLREHRIIRGEQIIDKLKDMKINIDIKNIKEQNENENDFIGRVAIARELIKEHHVNSIQEAFNLYLNPGKPAYVERFKLTIEDAVSLIKDAGGIPVLAHPGLLRDQYIIQHCIQQGIEGIECIHSKHSKKQSKVYKNIAFKNNLIVTGGSDCHGELYNGELLLGRYTVDLNSIPIIKERLNDNL